MLSPEALAFSRQRKALFWSLLQGPAYANAAAWHATSDAEAEDLRQFGVTAPIAIIPNGVDEAPTFGGFLSPSPPKGTHTLLFLSRIHPKKGLMNLLAAWQHVSDQFPTWHLRIVGPDEAGHAGELTSRIRALGLSRITLEPPVFGDEKWKLLASADLFVLPTQNENFGIVVAEALSAGVPAIVTKGAPWSGLQENECGWWIDQGVAPLSNALNVAMRLSDGELYALGENGRVWVRQAFGWERIARNMISVYDWLGSDRAPPDCVYI
jgi:glycosyltransferase involved in cell wall biosynthesis